MHGFTGHVHADDVALIHMNGRVYDPVLGRFLSVDPIVQFPSSTQSLNPYSYLMNNPFAGRDPSGFCMAETGTHIQGDCLTVTANYSDGSTKNLGSFNLRSTGDWARASGVALNSNGADAQSSKGATSAPTSGNPNEIGSNGRTNGVEPGMQTLETVTVEASYRTEQSVMPGDWSTSMNGRILNAEKAWYDEAVLRANATESGYDMIRGFYGFQWKMILSQFGGDAPAVGLAGGGGALMRAAGEAGSELRGVTGFISDATIVSRGKILGRGTVDVRAVVEGIRSGTLAPRDIFQNREGLLPKQPSGYYMEYVQPTPNVRDVGPQG